MDYWGPNSGPMTWRLTPTEVRQVLSLRYSMVDYLTFEGEGLIWLGHESFFTLLCARKRFPRELSVCMIIFFHITCVSRFPERASSFFASVFVR